MGGGDKFGRGSSATTPVERIRSGMGARVRVSVSHKPPNSPALVHVNPSLRAPGWAFNGAARAGCALRSARRWLSARAPPYHPAPRA